MKGPLLQKRWNELPEKRKQRINENAAKLEQEYLKQSTPNNMEATPSKSNPAS